MPAVIVRSTFGWRRTGQSSAWLDQCFSANCGSILYTRAEALTVVLSVSVGCFEDPAFPPAEQLHWPERKHERLEIEALTGRR